MPERNRPDVAGRGPLALPAAAGAIAGQLTLAGGSFLLQLLAARSLGAAGLGAYALILGSIVLATSLTSGFVGDSLTVLDRHDPRIRSALASVAMLLVVGAGALALIGGRAAGLGAGTAGLFALAGVAFMTADLLRRTLMACRRFAQLVFVDAAALVASLLAVAVAARGDLHLAHFVAALWLGQLVACVVAASLLPAHERTLPALAWGDVQAVVAFGSWRAAQQFVRPTTINLARWLVLIVAGQAAVGQLEGARLFVAPALLLVQGVGSWLFASFATDRTAPLADLLRLADRGAAALLASSVVVAVVATIAVPVLGDVLTGGGYDLAVPAVLGWGIYAASCAVVLPYGSLAAVRGRQAGVFGLRVLDAATGLAATAVALWWLGASPSVAPWLLSVGSVGAGLLVRQRLLVPLAVARPREEVLA